MGGNKTKSILFGTKLNIKPAEPLNIIYGNVKMKAYDISADFIKT